MLETSNGLCLLLAPDAWANDEAGFCKRAVAKPSVTNVLFNLILLVEFVFCFNRIARVLLSEIFGGGDV